MGWLQYFKTCLSTKISTHNHLWSFQGIIHKLSTVLWGVLLWIKMPPAHFNGLLTECEADSSWEEPRVEPLSAWTGSFRVLCVDCLSGWLVWKINIYFFFFFGSWTKIDKKQSKKVNTPWPLLHPVGSIFPSRVLCGIESWKKSSEIWFILT